MTGRLFLALLILGLPLLSTVVGMAVLDRLAGRRERRLRPGLFISPPPPVSLDAARLSRRLRAARRAAATDIRSYRRNIR